VVQLTVFLLVCLGTTNILATSRLLAGLRRRLERRSALAGYWARCPMCMGVPVGMAWNLVGLDLGLDVTRVVEVLVAGAVSSGWCWVLHVVLQRLGAGEL
jgi:hypothetical protein